jgi:hypothetical protein
MAQSSWAIMVDNELAAAEATKVHVNGILDIVGNYKRIPEKLKEQLTKFVNDVSQLPAMRDEELYQKLVELMKGMPAGALSIINRGSTHPTVKTVCASLHAVKLQKQVIDIKRNVQLHNVHLQYQQEVNTNVFDRLAVVEKMLNITSPAAPTAPARPLRPFGRPAKKQA